MTGRRVLLVAKTSCLRSQRFLQKVIARDLHRLDGSIVTDYLGSPGRSASQQYDLVVAAGGDGTILRVSSAFQGAAEEPPPILPFSLGTLGFLLPFPASERGPNTRRILELALQNALPSAQRSRLAVCVGPREFTALNEICVHRGQRSRVIRLRCLLGKTRLTDTVADGLLVATPTGSSAYALSAGGPLVHPCANVLLLAPVCPRSLSFRPLVLPIQSASIVLQLLSGDGSANISVDGRVVIDGLSAQEPVHVSRHPQPLRMFHQHGDLDMEWTRRLNRTLFWNIPFKERGQRLPACQAR